MLTSRHMCQKLDNMVNGQSTQSKQPNIGHDSKQTHLVDHRASEALRFVSLEQKSLAQGKIVRKIHC